MSEVPIQILAFDDLIRNNIDEFLTLCTNLGGPLIEFGPMVKDAFNKCRKLIEFGLVNNIPKDMNSFFRDEPLSAAILAIQEFRESNRKNADFFNHLSMISESILSLNWIMIKPAPTQFIRDMKDAGTFYGNRVLVSHKGDSNHSNWITKWGEILLQLELYVKQYFLTGFTWGSAQGKMVQSGPPPPPPPPAPELFGAGQQTASDDARQALIKDLNQGTGITSRLKKVNKGEHSQRTQVHEAAHKPMVAAKPTAKVYPPKFQLEGRKWIVEHQRDNPSMTVDNEMSQSLAMYSCQTSFLEILNKINNIVIDSCKKTSIIIRSDVISCVEIIRSEGVKIQFEGIVQLVNVASSDNIQIFVNDHSKQNLQLISSKSSGMNMCLMKADGDYIEYPVPEQISCQIEGNRLKSTVVDNIY